MNLGVVTLQTLIDPRNDFFVIRTPLSVASRLPGRGRSRVTWSEINGRVYRIQANVIYVDRKYNRCHYHTLIPQLLTSAGEPSPSTRFRFLLLKNDVVFGDRVQNGSPYAIRPLSVLSVLSLCNTGVLWPNGWMDQYET